LADFDDPARALKFMEVDGVAWTICLPPHLGRAKKIRPQIPPIRAKHCR
jgi:hypothetical protein